MGGKKKGRGRCRRRMRGCSGAALGTYKSWPVPELVKVILFLIIVAGCVGAEGLYLSRGALLRKRLSGNFLTQTLQPMAGRE